jgi:hypothetical protein
MDYIMSDLILANTENEKLYNKAGEIMVAMLTDAFDIQSDLFTSPISG